MRFLAWKNKIALAFLIAGFSGVHVTAQESTQLDFSDLIEPNKIHTVSDKSESKTQFASFLDDEHDHAPQSYTHSLSDHDLKHDRVDTHAPAGLMGEHVHEKGEFMFEYKYAHMWMDDMRTGTTRLSDAAALSGATNGTGIGFAITPTRMHMEMHMLHFMYGVSDDTTAYIMPMWMSNNMDHISGMGTRFTTNVQGFSDLGFGALFKLIEGDEGELIMNLGMTAPTGDIDDIVQTPPGPALAPYPMRVGTGTWNVIPSLTYKKYFQHASFGSQFSSFIPVESSNSRGYSVGNDYRLNAWFSRNIDQENKHALSFRVESIWKENYDGFDPTLGANNTTVSTARPDMRGGDFVNLGFGAMSQLEKGGRLNFEIVIPVYQKMDGVQLETDMQLFGSYSKAF